MAMLAIAAMGVGMGIDLPAEPTLPPNRRRPMPVAGSWDFSRSSSPARSSELDEETVAAANTKRERRAAKRVAQALRTERSAAAKGVFGS
jgi:hypothetical protein